MEKVTISMRRAESLDLTLVYKPSLKSLESVLMFFQGERLISLALETLQPLYDICHNTFVVYVCRPLL
jgi:hypothetical protein